MKINHIWAVYFSPTGGTQKAVTAVAECLSKELQIEYSELDITSKASRETTYKFEKEDLLIIGSPVYASRLPNKIMPDYEKCLLGHQTLALPVCVYGNRSYGDSLTELRAILENNEFRVIGGAALVSEHAFSNKLAIGRPDQNDLKEIADFTARIAANIRENDMVSPIVLSEEEKVDHTIRRRRKMELRRNSFRPNR